MNICSWTTEWANGTNDMKNCCFAPWCDPPSANPNRAELGAPQRKRVSSSSRKPVEHSTRPLLLGFLSGLGFKVLDWGCYHGCCWVFIRVPMRMFMGDLSWVLISVSVDAALVFIALFYWGLYSGSCPGLHLNLHWTCLNSWDSIRVLDMVSLLNRGVGPLLGCFMCLNSGYHQVFS